MASSVEIRQWLSEVNDIDAQAATLEQAVVALHDCADVTLVDDVLRVFERCSGQDDYGMFSSAQSWMEGLADQGDGVVR